MATSRTGTAQYKRWRTQVLHRDQADGITHCPLCDTPLDYSRTQRPNSAEPDHITPHSHGGTNTLDNGRTICRTCNIQRGNNTNFQTTRNPQQQHAQTITNLVNW